MAKRSKGNEPWWIKMGLLQGLCAAFITGAVAIGVSYSNSKSKSPSAVEQNCEGELCIQMDDNSGIININPKQKHFKDETK